MNYRGATTNHLPKHNPLAHRFSPGLAQRMESSAPESGEWKPQLLCPSGACAHETSVLRTCRVGVSRTLWNSKPPASSHAFSRSEMYKAGTARQFEANGHAAYKHARGLKYQNTNSGRESFLMHKGRTNVQPRRYLAHPRRQRMP